MVDGAESSLGELALMVASEKAGGEARMAMWEQHVDGLCVAAMRKGVMPVDELRRRIEGLEGEAQEHLSYYAKWACALVSSLLDKGRLQQRDVVGALGLGQVEQRPEPFAANAAVVVRTFDFATAWRKPHLRTPGYIFGARGVVEALVGSFDNPEAKAFADAAQTPANAVPKARLYRVRFKLKDIYTPTDHANPEDTVTAEVYEMWLAADDGDRSHDDPPPKRARTQALPHAHSHSHEHLPRAEVEKSAVETEGEEKPGQHLAEAVVRLAVEKAKLATWDELRASIQRLEAAGRDDLGQRIVARAWTDPDFKQRLLADAPSAIKDAFGRETSNDTAPTQLIVVANEPTVRHLVVCTLCSCYPRTVLGPSPSWYKSRHYRSMAVREPRKLLAIFGTAPDASTRVEVHDATADCRWFVLPERPAGTEGMDEASLRLLVSRDSMIGVAPTDAPVR